MVFQRYTGKHIDAFKIKRSWILLIKKISHAQGKGSLNHNNRKYFCTNIDKNRTIDNIYYAKESIEEAYDKCFGQALLDYNALQKRKERKINNYYDYLFRGASKDTVATSTNKEKSFYELVIGIGDKNSCPVGSTAGDVSAKILDEYAKTFQKRNPNFYVFNSVLHMMRQHLIYTLTIFR